MSSPDWSPEGDLVDSRLVEEKVQSLVVGDADPAIHTVRVRYPSTFQITIFWISPCAPFYLSSFTHQKCRCSPDFCPFSESFAGNNNRLAWPDPFQIAPGDFTQTPRLFTMIAGATPPMIGVVEPLGNGDFLLPSCSPVRSVVH